MIWCARGFIDIEKGGALTGAPFKTFPFNYCVDLINIRGYR